MVFQRWETDCSIENIRGGNLVVSTAMEKMRAMWQGHLHPFLSNMRQMFCDSKENENLTYQSSSQISSPARNETIGKAPVPDDDSTNALHTGAGLSLSLERCIEIFNRTRRCSCLHTETEKPYGCNLEQDVCKVCRKITRKEYYS